MTKQSITRPAPALLLGAIAMLALAPLARAAEAVSGVQVSGASVVWTPADPSAASELTVTPNGGEPVTSAFGPGESPTVSSRGLSGWYGWEVRRIPALGADDRAALAAARESGTEAEVIARLVAEGKVVLPQPVSSGMFQVEGGEITLAAPADETANGDRDVPVPVTNQLINDDLYVVGSIGLGIDITNGEAMGFDTIRLEENSLRIHFEDSSTDSGFPTNDWRLVANDTFEGGDNFFALEDSTSGRQVFRVDAGARNNAVYVDSAGEVGFGTDAPATELHLVIGDTPTIRFEQNNSSGFGAQTFDVAGNEVGFFIRDVTNGGVLGFRMLPGVEDNFFTIAGTERVGLRALSPSARLHINSNNSDDFLRLQNQSGGFDALLVDQNGNVTIHGTLTESSDREMKENFRPVDPDEVLAKVAALPISVWNFRSDADDTPHMGPMAQDFHAAFGLNRDERHISPLDVNGVALAAIQGLNEKRETQEQRIERLERENSELRSRLERLERIASMLERADAPRP